ncbi:MAG: peptidoglycan editing factor PgeF [Candidatus Cloacimonetes bacterium]|nr:peptidoglycan editing factor PgeF [Candidatus Cloacimonadota bacterium]
MGTKEKLVQNLSRWGQFNILAELRQVHSCNVITINTPEEFGFLSKEADAYVTAQSGIALAIRTADCYPLLFWDPLEKVIGAAHSGREGTRLNIGEATIQAMQALGAKDIQAAIGPGISGEKYQVDEHIWQKFVDSTGIAQNFPFLDLRKVINAQLINSGIKKEHIFHQEICTFSDHNYYSYRRDQTSERQYSFIIFGVH